jgi:hypothetical protein
MIAGVAAAKLRAAATAVEVRMEMEPSPIRRAGRLASRRRPRCWARVAIGVNTAIRCGRLGRLPSAGTVQSIHPHPSVPG